MLTAMLWVDHRDALMPSDRRTDALSDNGTICFPRGGFLSISVLLLVLLGHENGRLLCLPILVRIRLCPSPRLQSRLETPPSGAAN